MAFLRRPVETFAKWVLIVAEVSLQCMTIFVAAHLHSTDLLFPTE